MGSYFKGVVLICALLPFAATGCVQMSSRYVKGSEYERALVLYESGRINEARDKAKSVPRNHPDYRSARKLIADINAVSIQLSKRHFEMADDYERAGIYSKAASEYGESLAYNPSNAAARSRLGQLTAALKAGERPAAAEEEPKPRKAAKEEPPEDIANEHYLKGKLFFDAKAYGRAMDEFALCIKAVPSYMNAKDLHAKAKAERDRAVDMHLKKGMEYFQTEEMELAIKEWDAVLELDPTNRVAADYKNRAEVILERLQRIRDKRAMFE